MSFLMSQDKDTKTTFSRPTKLLQRELQKIDWYCKQETGNGYHDTWVENNEKKVH